MGLLKRLFAAVTTESAPSDSDERLWLRPDEHDGTPLALSIRDDSWQGTDSPMVTRSYELTNSAGFILSASNCGVTRWPTLGLYHLKVAGESHRPASALGSAVLGSAALLVPEPTNSFDKNAIRIETSAGAHVGYVAASNTKSARRVMRSEPVHAAFWAHHLRNGRELIALEIMIWRPGVIDGLLDVPLHPAWVE